MKSIREYGHSCNSGFMNINASSSLPKYKMKINTQLIRDYHTFQWNASIKSVSNHTKWITESLYFALHPFGLGNCEEPTLKKINIFPLGCIIMQILLANSLLDDGLQFSWSQLVASRLMGTEEANTAANRIAYNCYST